MYLWSKTTRRGLTPHRNFIYVLSDTMYQPLSFQTSMADLHQTGNSSLKGGDDNNNSYGTVSSLLPGDTVHISPYKDMSQSKISLINRLTVTVFIRRNAV